MCLVVAALLLSSSKLVLAAFCQLSVGLWDEVVTHPSELKFGSCG